MKKRFSVSTNNNNIFTQFFNRKAYENLLLMDFNWILLYTRPAFNTMMLLTSRIQSSMTVYCGFSSSSSSGEGEKFNLVGTFSTLRHIKNRAHKRGQWSGFFFHIKLFLISFLCPTAELLCKCGKRKMTFLEIFSLKNRPVCVWHMMNFYWLKQRTYTDQKKIWQ